MRTSERIAACVLAALLWSCTPGTNVRGDEPRPRTFTLDMAKAVVCQKVEGYERFTPLPDSSLTSEDKLQVYYRPLGFKVEAIEKPRPGFRYRAKFSQDGQIRRKGEKAVLMKKDRIVEYEPTFDSPTQLLYMNNKIGLKGLPPGEYEYDIILRDALDEGATARQSVAFKIVPVAKFDPPKDEGPDEPESPPSPKVEPKSKKKAAKSL